jgi:hypothetical protein
MSSPVPNRSVTASAISPTTNKWPDCFQVLLAVLALPTYLSTSAGLTFQTLKCRDCAENQTAEQQPKSGTAFGLRSDSSALVTFHTFQQQGERNENIGILG